MLRRVANFVIMSLVGTRRIACGQILPNFKKMKINIFSGFFHNFWHNIAQEWINPSGKLYLAIIGIAVGIVIGAIISVFRITTNAAFRGVLMWTQQFGHSPKGMGIWIGMAVLAALVTGFLVRNPAIRFGGEDWIMKALNTGQKSAWLKVLIPKFIGSWLVMACGISVGREGPSIQMGAATALGMKRFDPRNSIERRFLILGGSGAGLAAAFSAPFSGICYVYEIMEEKLSPPLFVFLLATGFGVYISNVLIFGLDVLLPMGPVALPSLAWYWVLIPLAIFAGATGIAYNFFLRFSMLLYGRQKLLPPVVRPLLAFVGAALVVLFFPVIAGEGLTIFTNIEAGQIFAGYLCLFLVAKLFFTAFCYGSGIPAGLMVPVLCLGGVTGAIYADVMTSFGLMPAELVRSCWALGMCGAFAAAERAPLTGLVLVIEMTGTFVLAPGMLLVGGIAAIMARLAVVKKIEKEAGLR